MELTKRQELLSKIADCCFYLAVIIEVLIVIIDKSALTNPIEGRLFQVTFLLFFIKACLTKYSWKEYLAIALLLIIGGISYIATDRNEIIRFVMFIAACKNIDIQKCLKLVFYLTLSGCILIIMLSILGSGGAVSLTQDYGRGSVETRYTLGMGHPNALQCMVWALTVLGLYLFGETMKWWHYILVLTVNAGFFLLTGSKTSLLAGIFAVAYAAAFCFSKSERLKKIYGISGVLITFGSVAVSVFIAGNAHYVYDYDWNFDRSAVPTFYYKIDNILTGRIRTLTETDGWEGTIQTWKLFSEPSNNHYFDMGWVRLFYWYGIIPACIFIIVLFLIMFYCYKNKKYMALMLITSFAAYSIVEAHAVSVYLARNYVLFIIGAYWSKVFLWKRGQKLL